MNSELIVGYLGEIKFLLIANLVVTSILLLGLSFKAISRIIKRWTVSRDDVFIHFASDLYDEKKYDELINYCEEKISSLPNNPYPLYWLARGKVKVGELVEAKALFEKILLMEPEWKKQILPHLEQIEKPTNQTLKRTP